jgi:hypothetical protein
VLEVLAYVFEVWEEAEVVLVGLPQKTDTIEEQSVVAVKIN